MTLDDLIINPNPALPGGTRGERIMQLVNCKECLKDLPNLNKPWFTYLHLDAFGCIALCIVVGNKRRLLRRNQLDLVLLYCPIDYSSIQTTSQAENFAHAQPFLQHLAMVACKAGPVNVVTNMVCFSGLH